MSEEKKINAQECLKLDQEELDQVAGGDDDEYVHLIEVKPACAFCGSKRYYSYPVFFQGKEYTRWRCPDCNYAK